MLQVLKIHKHTVLWKSYSVIPLYVKLTTNGEGFEQLTEQSVQAGPSHQIHLKSRAWDTTESPEEAQGVMIGSTGSSSQHM